MASTRLRDPATGRFISAEAGARVLVPAAKPVVTGPAPVTKNKKKHEKQQGKKKPKNKKSNKKKSDKKRKKEKKG